MDVDLKFENCNLPACNWLNLVTFLQAVPLPFRLVMRFDVMAIAAAIPKATSSSRFAFLPVTVMQYFASNIQFHPLLQHSYCFYMFSGYGDAIIDLTVGGATLNDFICFIQVSVSFNICNVAWYCIEFDKVLLNGLSGKTADSDSASAVFQQVRLNSEISDGIFGQI